MSQYVYIYVGEDAEPNFKIGMDQLIWGWKQPRHGPTATDAADWLQDPREPTYLVFVEGATRRPTLSGWPRTPVETWRVASYAAITLARLTGTLYEAVDPVWPDATYRYRVRFDYVTPLGSFTASQLHPDATEAIRGSAVRQGRPILGPDPLLGDPSQIQDDLVTALHENTPLAGASLGAPATTAMLPDEDLPESLFDDFSDLDGVTRTVVRREQRMLRSVRFGSLAEVPCALCGRVLPVGLVRLAHIKRRAEATRDERLQPKNTMPACTLGCDELFERGYLIVDQLGKIRGNPAKKSASPDLADFLGRFEGRGVQGYTSGQQPFFSWHRDRHLA